MIERREKEQSPKSKFSRMRTINAPGTSSSASGFSLIGFQRSVPGIRPCIYKCRCARGMQVNEKHSMSEWKRELTRIVILVFEERCTTRRRDIIKLTTMPTSTFQTMEKKNVRNINDRSTHARILFTCK